MKILITGGAGFIGSHLCEKYVSEGETVFCLDNFENGDLRNIYGLITNKKFKLIHGDIRDSNLLEKIMPRVDAIIHLAAQIHVERSIIEPKLTYDVNVLGTLNLLEVARRYDVEKIIHTSTSEVYGSARSLLMNEDHPLCAPHPYGASKIAADRLCYAYVQTFGMNICIARPFNTFGPKQKDHGYGGAISIFTRRVLSGRPPIIYGDGSQTRDYMYIDDLVKAYDLVLKSNKSLKEVINFGTGKDVKIIDLANKIIELCDHKRKIEPVHVAPRPGEIKQMIADYSKAKKLLGWEPKYTLERGLEEFVEWYKSFKFAEWEKLG
jgi:UDP-glucose 4-epimerase